MIILTDKIVMSSQIQKTTFDITEP